MSDPWNPIPVGFVEVFHDEEEDLEDEDIAEELAEEQEEPAEHQELIDQELHFKMSIYSQAPGGSLICLNPENDSNISHGDHGDEEELLQAEENFHELSSFSSSDYSDIDSERIEVETEPVQVVPRRGRGAVRGRGLRRLRVRGSRGGSGWERGQPLIERFVSDEELPEQLREEFAQLRNSRNRRQTERKRRLDEENERNDEEVFFDAEDDFVWLPMDDWRGVKENFLPESSGPTRIYTNAYDVFRAFWDDNILSYITHETNEYAKTIQRARFHRDWFDTNPDEILTLFGFWMMLSIIKMPTIKSCFSKIPILRTDVFSHIFCETRYWNLNAAFHLASGSFDTNDRNNALYPMGPIIEHLNKKFQELYKLEQNICIDESLTLWKGPVRFRQYIKTKAAKFGIKTFHLCESSTGYLWSFFVYTGLRTVIANISSSSSAVLQLIRPLLNLGHVLYMDNWFNSPLLARFLKRNHTDCVGTLRPNKKNVPPVIQRCPLAEGEFLARQSGDVMIVALQDKKRLTCLSTFHDVSQIQTEARNFQRSQYKLKLVSDYNKNMGGVDRLDQMLEPYLIERKKCIKWTRKLFKRLLNITIQNARIILEKSTHTKIDSLAFRLSLVQAIIDKHLPNVPRKSASVPRQRHQGFPISRLTERHFIRRIPITDEMRQSGQHRTNLGRRLCVWCTRVGKRRTKTSYECPQCEMPLCLEACFEAFHTIA